MESKQQSVCSEKAFKREGWNWLWCSLVIQFHGSHGLLALYGLIRWHQRDSCWLQERNYALANHSQLKIEQKQSLEVKHDEQMAFETHTTENSFEQQFLVVCQSSPTGPIESLILCFW